MTSCPGQKCILYSCWDIPIKAVTKNYRGINTSKYLEIKALFNYQYTNTKILRQLQMDSDASIESLIFRPIKIQHPMSLPFPACYSCYYFIYLPHFATFFLAIFLFILWLSFRIFFIQDVICKTRTKYSQNFTPC